jgi:hypothetical protein
VSRNVIGEVVERHTSFLIGSEPRWGWSRGARWRKARADERRAGADRRGRGRAHDLVGHARRPRLPAGSRADRPVWARAHRSGSTSRLACSNSPSGRTVVTRATLDEALAKLWPDHPSYAQATVYEDEDTKQQLGVFLYAQRLDGELDAVELSFLSKARRRSSASSSAPPMTVEFAAARRATADVRDHAAALITNRSRKRSARSTSRCRCCRGTSSPADSSSACS